MWIVCGILSVVFTVLNWVFTVRNDKKAHVAALGALSFMALTVFMEYRLVLNWVNHEDWSALMDVVPSMSGILAGYIALIIVFNALALVCQKQSSL